MCGLTEVGFSRRNGRIYCGSSQVASQNISLVTPLLGNLGLILVNIPTLKQRSGEVGILCDLAPPTVCNTVRCYVGADYKQN